MKKIILNISLLLFVLMPVLSWAQSDWMVSKKKQKDTNPITYSKESVKAGKIVFLANCKSCHGDPGKANGLPLAPPPTDIALQTFLDKNSDGSLFHKMTDGQATMPTYKTILNNEQRWNIVNYIRSFDTHFSPKTSPKKATAKTEPKKTQEAEITSPYSLSLKIDADNSKATTVFYGTQDGEKVTIKDVEIFVGIKRYFGNLPIMEAGATTNENGVISVEYPTDLPSGENGSAKLIAYVIDKDKYGNISKTSEIQITATHPSHFSETRALWANRGNFPIWLISTYLIFLAIAWGVMGMAVFNVVKIVKLGK